jgi:hypothetical protein
MPSRLHEVLVELFRQRPALAAELLATAFGFELPPHRAVSVEAGDSTDVRPTRITGCTDLDQLAAWVRRAATASSVDDLFD